MSSSRLFAPLLPSLLALVACGSGPLPTTKVEPPQPTCAVPVSDDDPAYGDVDALVTVVFFGNPTQPETYRALDEVLAITVREGNSRVRAVYKFLPQPNDAEGERLADTSLSVRELAGTTAFFQYQRLLLGGFVSGAPRPFSADQLSTWAKLTGVQNDAAFRSGGSTKAKNREGLDAHATLARRLGITATPTLFVNGQRTPFLPEGVVTETIERELKKAESRLSTGLDRQKLYAVSCAENGGRSAGESRPVESTLSSGLVIKDTEVGKGREALAGDKVVVHYKGTLDDGTVFDTSVGRGPFEFALGKRQVIAGWERGVVGMRVGGKRTLVVPSELGYGTRGQPPKIPPRATLHFDIELLEVKAGDPPPPKEPKEPQK